MPSSILNTDIMFPNLSGKSTEQQVFTIMNYLYMLKEQLTYSLSNLGLDNINANSFIEIAGIINQPVILRLDGVDGSLAEINVNLGTVSTQLKDAEGNISSLQQTAASLSAQLEISILAPAWGASAYLYKCKPLFMCITEEINTISDFL